jgi:hypothetical protein
MSAVGFDRCRECGRKLQNTFFCQECGQPFCSLDCYCRHHAGHPLAQTPRDAARSGVPPQLGMSEELVQGV